MTDGKAKGAEPSLFQGLASSPAREATRRATSLAEPRLLGRGEGLGNCLYVTCSRCSYSCKPIRLQDLKTSRYARDSTHASLSKHGPRTFRRGFLLRPTVLFSSMSLRQLIVEVASALGISTLKSQQSEAIFQFLHGRDVFVALPTGYGKSLCYMALPWIFDRLRGVTNQSVVLVVSPLVALMADQVAQCCSCAVARYVMLCQCGCRLRNQTFLGNKSRIGNSPGLLLSREGVAPRG